MKTAFLGLSFPALSAWQKRVINQDLISERHLREIADQFLDGKARIEFSDDEGEDEED